MIKSIILNFTQLVFALICGLIIMYLFAIIGFIEFQKYYTDQAKIDSTTFYSIFAGTINYAFRKGTI